LDVCVLVYLDDILVYSKNPEEHERHLRQVLDLLRANKLYAKWPKCEFFQDQVEYLGHIITKDGVKTDPAKCEAVAEWPTCKRNPDCTSRVYYLISFSRYIPCYWSTW